MRGAPRPIPGGRKEHLLRGKYRLDRVQGIDTEAQNDAVMPQHR
jgi:hypothetical protein